MIKKKIYNNSVVLCIDYQVIEDPKELSTNIVY